MNKYQEYLKTVKENGCKLDYVPLGLRDREMCLEAVKNRGYAFRFVPREFTNDREICLEAVKNDGEVLLSIPVKLKDKEICLEAVKQRGEYIKYVPRELWNDKDICLTAVKHGDCLTVLKYIPYEVCDREIYLEVVKHSMFGLNWVPERFKDKEMLEAHEAFVEKYRTQKSEI